MYGACTWLRQAIHKSEERCFPAAGSPNYADKLEILSSMNIRDGANFLGRELAEQALRSLETLGRTGCQVIENKYPIEDNAFFDLESVGLAAVERP